MKFVFLFIDGVGLAPPSPDNPVNPEVCPTLCRLIAQHAVPIDACLSMPGLPQSATGQATMFTGVNAPVFMGRHCEGFPGPGLRDLIGKDNLFLQLKARGKKVMIAAGDTFRAGAVEQVRTWANRAGAELIAQGEGGDPSAVVFDAVSAAKARNTDILLIDTAGRLHNKKNLMDELAKMRRIISKEYPEACVETLIVLDGSTGQNALEQARQFSNVTEINGIVLTKLDGTAKGGIAVAIESELSVPVKYIGVGNESWGCGGNMRIEYYADLYRRYSTYCREYNGNELFKIASGATDYDYEWTEVAMKQIGTRMKGLSLHYYTCYTWEGSKGSATNFDENQYYWAVAKCATGLKEVLDKHVNIMDRYDAKGKVKLLVDEWGTWWDEEPGSIRGHLYQQNSMRDAMVAAFSLNLFHQYTKRVSMTNIAQVANVLQSMVLTKDDKMVLTPTYYVFKMYTPNMEAVNIPVTVNSDTFTAENERDKDHPRQSPYISVSASRSQDGSVNVNLANADLKNDNEVSLDLGTIGANIQNALILTSPDMKDHNTFENPDKVKPQPFKDAQIKDGKLIVKMPKMSVVTLTVK